MPVPFQVHPIGSPNGKEVLAYDNALYEAFKSALLGKTECLISNGQTDEKFLRSQARRLVRNPKPKIGPWIEYAHGTIDLIHFHEARKEDERMPDCTGYTTTIKFIPPMLEKDFVFCIERFKKEFGIEDSSETRCPYTEDQLKGRPKLANIGAASVTYSRVGLQYRPTDNWEAGTISSVIIEMPESEFDKIRNQIVLNRSHAV